MSTTNSATDVYSRVHDGFNRAELYEFIQALKASPTIALTNGNFSKMKKGELASVITAFLVAWMRNDEGYARNCSVQFSSWFALRRDFDRRITKVEAPEIEETEDQTTGEDEEQPKETVFEETVYTEDNEPLSVMIRVYSYSHRTDITVDGYGIKTYSYSVEIPVAVDDFLNSHGLYRGTPDDPDGNALDEMKAEYEATTVEEFVELELLEDDEEEQDPDTYRENCVLDWLIDQRDWEEDERFDLDSVLDTYADDRWSFQDPTEIPDTENKEELGLNLSDLLKEYEEWSISFSQNCESYRVMFESLHNAKSFARKLRKRYGFYAVTREAGSLEVILFANLAKVAA